MNTTVQLNVRMERPLRDAGNESLLSKGVSPSEFVRAIWKKLAQRGQPLEDVLAVVFGNAGRSKPTIDTTSPIDQGQALYNTLLRDLDLQGISHKNAFVGRTHKQMMEDALLQRWQEKGL